MTVQDMDICLNISTGPAGSSSKKNTGNGDDFVLNSMKGVKGLAFKKRNAQAVGKSMSSSHNQSFDGNKRIKQKSLSAIVARQLSTSNAKSQHMIAQRQTLPETETTTVKNKKFANKVDNTFVKARDKVVESDKSLLNKDDDSSSKSIVSFAKATTENVGKTLVARKRNISEVGSRKTLSNIFSEQTEPKSVEFNVLDSVEKADTENSEIPKKRSKFNEPKKTFHSTNKSHFENQKEKNFVENRPNIRGENHNSSQFHNKSGGKFASLFGHNPEIPNIGQRLVKPINEQVFTGTNFTDLDIHPFTISNLEQNMNITKMTTVQQKAIPQIFLGKDVLIRSQTGSGKTLAYALPIVELLHKARPKLERNSGLKALVIVPTRELALQTYECFLKLIKPFRRIVPGYLSGGEKRKSEKARLRKGCNILVGTPGRVLDHIKHTKVLKLDEVKYFVLDEADRMFDMGYEKDISGIVSALKVSTPSENTSYNAMEMLRQNVKKVFTDEDIGDLAENTAGDKDHSQTDSNDKDRKCTVSAIEKKEHSESEDEARETNKKLAYHSSSDSDSETEESIVKSKKTNKGNVGKKVIPKPESSASDSNPQEDKTTDADSDQSSRQTILLSATLTQAVEKLAGLTMENPTFVDAAKENLEISGGDASEVNEDLVVPQSVIQTYIVTPPKLRMVTLSGYIAGKCQSHGEHKILIFMATQDMVDYHADILSSVLTKPADEDDEDSDPLVDVEFFKLHGNMTQKERTDVFKTFRKAKSGVLFCTDVAARGLDMPKVDCVIQYTGPLSARDYVHRIGRTGRAGCSGTATIFLTPPEIEFVRMLESRRIRIKQEDMDDALRKLLGPLSRYGTPHTAATALQNEFETMVLQNSKLREKAHKAYISWVRFYSSYPRDMREIFNRKELHLGHYTKSFALRDTPQQIGGIGKKLREKYDSKPQHQNRLANERPDGVSQKKQKDGGPKTWSLKKVRMLNTSEYGSGLEPVKKPKKT